MLLTVNFRETFLRVTKKSKGKEGEGERDGRNKSGDDNRTSLKIRIYEEKRKKKKRKKKRGKTRSERKENLCTLYNTQHTWVTQFVKSLTHYINDLIALYELCSNFSSVKKKRRKKQRSQQQF